VLQKAEDEARSQAQAIGRDIREQAKRAAEKDARKIVALAVQRLAAEATAETTVSAVPLPNDEMKGRIIGREGRNIRAFELATGVDVIIDDTPDTVVVSCFDPVRREVARRTLEKLIVDGRIHPGSDRGAGRQGAQGSWRRSWWSRARRRRIEVGVHGAAPGAHQADRADALWRTSYGQNIYDHSKEVAWLAGMMAAELGLDVRWPSGARCLHDIGKVLTHEHEGTHVQLGVEVARQVRRAAAGHQLHRGPPRRRAARKRVGAGAGRRFHQRDRGPARGARRLRRT
jgi:ribonuclease Y